MPFNDLREFIDAAQKLGQVKEIHGAHWNLEIGALTEMFAFKEPSPMVLFDQIPALPPIGERAVDYWLQAAERLDVDTPFAASDPVHLEATVPGIGIEFTPCLACS